MNNGKFSVSEIERIYGELSDLSGKDLSVFAFSFKKNRIVSFMKKNGIVETDIFLLKARKSDSLLSEFISFLYVPQSELFRDAEMWNYIAYVILPKLVQKKEGVSIHFPECIRGKDLYSLLFFFGIYNSSKIKIKVSYPLKDNQEIIKRGVFDKKDIKFCINNISMLKNIKDEKDVFSEKDNDEFAVRNFFEGEIIYDNAGIGEQDYISEFDLVFFRNRMIYYNAETQYEIIKKINASVKKGGYLILGEKENPGVYTGKFKQKKSGIKVYKKRFF